MREPLACFVLLLLGERPTGSLWKEEEEAGERGGKPGEIDARLADLARTHAQ